MQNNLQNINTPEDFIKSLESLFFDEIDKKNKEIKDLETAIKNQNEAFSNAYRGLIDKTTPQNAAATNKEIQKLQDLNNKNLQISEGQKKAIEAEVRVLKQQSSKFIDDNKKFLINLSVEELDYISKYLNFYNQNIKTVKEYQEAKGKYIENPQTSKYIEKICKAFDFLQYMNDDERKEIIRNLENEKQKGLYVESMIIDQLLERISNKGPQEEIVQEERASEINEKLEINSIDELILYAITNQSEDDKKTILDAHKATVFWGQDFDELSKQFDKINRKEVEPSEVSELLNQSKHLNNIHELRELEKYARADLSDEAKKLVETISKIGGIQERKNYAKIAENGRNFNYCDKVQGSIKSIKEDKSLSFEIRLNVIEYKKALGKSEWQEDFVTFTQELVKSHKEPNNKISISPEKVSKMEELAKEIKIPKLQRGIMVALHEIVKLITGGQKLLFTEQLKKRRAYKDVQKISKLSISAA
jgi:hypothetical protein